MPTITTITTMRRSLSRSRSFRAKEKSSNSILISRLSHTHCLLKLLIQVLDEMSRIELQVSKSYNTLSKTDSCPDFKSESHFHSVFTDLFLSFQKTSRHHSTVSEALSSIIVNLTSLKRKLKTLIKTVSDSNTLRVKQRRQDDELVSNSKRALVNSLSSIGNSLTSDPWMLHFKLKSATNISSENFKKRSIECKSEFESIKQLEDEIFNGVKSILAGLKNLDLKGALFNHVVETINRIDTKKEWDLFIRDHPNILEFEVEPDYSLDDLLKNQTLNLVKSGVISVPKPLLPGWYSHLTIGKKRISF